MSRQTIEDMLGELAALGDPIRRDLYLYVVAQPDAVSRVEAARALGISRDLAAFHLDKLVKEGWLAAEYRRLSDRRGPGAGRPSKLYRRSERELEVSLPPRDYKLLARLFTQGLTEDGEGAAGVFAAAHRLGVDLGSEGRRRAGRRPKRASVVQEAEVTLRAMGYEPFRERDGAVRFRNCPFHEIAREHPDLVCRMNLSLIEGLLEGLDLRGPQAELDRHAGLCCVVIRWMPRPSSASPA